MIRLWKLSLILGMPAPPDDDAGSKSLFVKPYRKSFVLDCSVELNYKITPASLGTLSQK